MWDGWRHMVPHGAFHLGLIEDHDCGRKLPAFVLDTHHTRRFAEWQRIVKATSVVMMSDSI
jgi:hypothetical protein